MTTSPPVAVIACGAIARELLALAELNQWHDLRLHCLPADLHNSPEKIPDRVRVKILQLRERYQKLFVAYADCGTGGLLDMTLAELGIERLAGAHCYEFFSGSDQFADMMRTEPGTFFVTDFLVRHFQRLVIQGLGLERYPQLRVTFFGSYRRLLYIAQTSDAELQARAESAAASIGLEYRYHYTGLHKLQSSMSALEVIQWRN